MHALRPTPVKLVFLLEWALFVALELARGRLSGAHAVLVAAAPLLVLYLLACAFSARARRPQPRRGTTALVALAAGLGAADQLAKAAVSAALTPGESVAVIEGWLHLARMHNERSSWFVKSFELPVDGPLVLLVPTALLILVALLARPYYVARHRRSLWADLAFVGLVAGLSSWILDPLVRGYTLDFVNLPGVVTFDLKDLLILLGGAALLAEAVDSPALTLRWRGLREEGRALRALVVDVYRFHVDRARRPPEA